MSAGLNVHVILVVTITILFISQLEAFVLSRSRIPIYTNDKATICSVYATSKSTLTATVEVLKQATLQRDVGASEVKNLLESAALGAKQKIDSKKLAGQWELVYSSLLPSGYLPLKEVVDFYGYTLTSAYGFLPLGTIEGDSSITATAPLTVTFQNKSIRFGPVKMNMKSDAKFYEFQYIDDAIAVAKSSSGGFSLLKKVQVS
jgi:hypothetical protein